MTRKQIIEIKVGQWWTEHEQSDFRRMKITRLTRETVEYLDGYVGVEKVYKRVSSRIQWELEIEQGKLIPSSAPGTKPA